MKRIIQFNPNLYVGCKLHPLPESGTWREGVTLMNMGNSEKAIHFRIVEKNGTISHKLTGYIANYKPILRTPDQMTSEEIQQFLTIINDAPTFDKDTAPTVNEIGIVATNYFLKDEETETYFMIVFSTRCFEGTLMLNEYGGIFLVETEEMMSKGSTASLLPIFYQVQAIDYLRSIHVDCDALISNGLAIKQE